MCSIDCVASKHLLPCCWGPASPARVRRVSRVIAGPGKRTGLGTRWSRGEIPAVTRRGRMSLGELSNLSELQFLQLESGFNNAMHFPPF